MHYVITSIIVFWAGVKCPFGLQMGNFKFNFLLQGQLESFSQFLTYLKCYHAMITSFFSLYSLNQHIFFWLVYLVLLKGAMLSWVVWLKKTTCVGCYKQLNTYYKFLITLNTQKTALPVLLYLCGNNWSLVLTTSAGWVTTDAIMPANAPQVNVSNELNSGVPSSDRQDTHH